MKKILSIIMIIVLSTILGLAYNASTNLSLRLLEATDDVRPFREDFNYNFELVDDLFDDVSLIEFDYLDGVTSAIQTQLGLRYLKTEIDSFSELQSIISDKTLVNVEDGIIATAIQDDLIVKADFANEDWGEVTISGNALTIDDGIIDKANIKASTDFGNLSTDASKNWTIDDNTILEADLKAVNASADEDILTKEDTTGDFEWHTLAELGIAATGQTFYIGTTQVAINRGTGALTLAGLTLTTPDIGTPSAGTLTNCSFPTLNQNTTGSAATLTTARNIGGVAFDGSAAITPIYLSLDHALGSDEDYVGITDTVTVGYTTAIGDLMYFDFTATEWLEAKADAFGTTPAMRIALEVKSDGQECLALVKGYIRDDNAFDFGAARIFLNDDTAGLCDDTAPAESGDQIQVVGIGITADILYFCPSIDVGEI